MIPFSVSMRANPANDQEPKKAYATAQCTEVMDLTAFSKHITTHGSKYTRADIYAVLATAVDCLRENLLDGKRIKLGELGTFYVTLESDGQESLEKFTSQNITSVNVNWRPGDNFLNLLDEAEFNCVATRDAAEKVLKAQKAGQTTVDISATMSAGDSSTDSGSTDSGGDTSTDSGSTDDSGDGEV